MAKHAPKFNRASIHRDRAKHHRPDNNRKKILTRQIELVKVIREVNNPVDTHLGNVFP